jgi:glucose dehydrogenase
VGVDDSRLAALDARTGEPISGFGTTGSVDLKASIGGADGPFMLESPPIVYRNILIFIAATIDRRFRVRCRHRQAALGNDAAGDRTCHPDDVPGAQRASVCGCCSGW